MAPNRIVDYVVEHGLCHLIHYNHSPEFWKAVASVITGYSDLKEWLKLNSKFLIL